MSEAVSGPTPRINHFQSGGLDCSPKRRLRQNGFWIYAKSPYRLLRDPSVPIKEPVPGFGGIAANRKITGKIPAFGRS